MNILINFQTRKPGISVLLKPKFRVQKLRKTRGFGKNREGNTNKKIVW